MALFTCQEYPSGVACFVEWLISHPKGSDVHLCIDKEGIVPTSSHLGRATGVSRRLSPGE